MTQARDRMIASLLAALEEAPDGTRILDREAIDRSPESGAAVARVYSSGFAMHRRLSHDEVEIRLVEKEAA